MIISEGGKMAKTKSGAFNIECNKGFSSGISTQVDWEPQTNIIVAQEEVIIEMELPGVEKEDICIELEGENELLIKGKKNQPKAVCDNPTYFLFEREFGKFYKRLVLDFQVDIGRTVSHLEDGVLMVKMPKKKKNKVKINIEEGGCNE
jgi:HSP20 family protein